jgi:hypothetical protein
VRRIVLANFDTHEGIGLAAFLSGRRRGICIVSSEASNPEHLAKEIMPTDLLIMDATGNGQFVLDFLEKVKGHRIHENLLPAVLCVSRVYRGARFELELTRKGATLVYL